MRAPYWPKPPTQIDPGTYRAPDGRLVHCRRESDRLTIEVDQESTTYGVLALHDLVLLSDDPDWPDWDHHHADVALFLD
ncbi:MAG: hypothetical protein WEE03_04635 [Chloroflexota bacterium]